MTQIRVGVNADSHTSFDVENVDSIEIGIGKQTYIISANAKGHLVIETINQKAMRVEGFDNQIMGKGESDRIVQGEIIVGNTVVLS